MLGVDLQAQFTYTTNNGSLKITGYTGPGGDVIIPSEINNLPVTGVGGGAFDVFRGCTDPTTVTIPDSVAKIERYVFSECMKLTAISIGSGVNSIGIPMFEGCPKLVAINVAASNPFYMSVDGVLFDKGRTTLVACPPARTSPYTIPDGVTSIENMAFAYCSGLTSVTLPETLTSIGSWTFGSMTFAFSGLTNITLPNSLTNLGSFCFAQCSNLQSATLSSSLTRLPNGAFYGCNNLASIAIPNSVTNIEPDVFNHCVGLTNVTFGNNVLYIGLDAFYGCYRLTNAIIPASTISIDSGAFWECTSLSSISVPASTKSISISAFDGCTNLSAFNVDELNNAYSGVDGVLLDKSQTKVILCPQGKTGNYVVPNSVTNIGPTSFYHCSNLTDVVFGGRVATIGAQAFESCVGLTRIALPDSLSVIQDGGSGKAGAFNGCTGLTNVTIGKGLTYLGGGAFFNCTNLVGAYFRGDAPTLGSDWPWTFVGSTATVYYLPETTGWGNTFATHPAVLWNPLPQTRDTSFGLKPSGFGFNIAGTADIPLVVEACTNLASQSWVLLQSSTLTNGLIYFSDPQWTNYPGRFYRIRSP
jgi:hypothetical protein